MQDGLLILDEKQIHIFENKAFRKMFGFSKEDLAGTSAPFPYWPPEEIENIFSAYNKTMAGQIDAFELVFMHKNGTRIWIIIAPSEFKDEQGNTIGYLATIKDISERKRLEQAVQESEQKWRSIAENPFDFVVVVDRKYRYLYVNHTAPGITPEMLIGKATPFDYSDPNHHKIMREAFDSTFETGKATSFDVYVPNLDSWYSSIVGPIREGDQVTSISILTRDITLQKKAEAALRQSEHQLRESHKMQSIGTLAGGIAHDLNNLLTPILGYAELAQSTMPPENPARELLAGIEKAGLRARDLVQRILLFSRRHEAKKEPVELCDSILEALKLLRATTPSNIRLETDLLQEPVFVFADSSQLHQVFTNLVANGLQAMRDTHGCLKIAMYKAPLESVLGELGPSVKDKFIHIAISDTGTGMDEETQRRAFEPFFSTKPVGAGTGLGLSIVHGIVLDHGGMITLKSAVGVGTTFTLSLPISQAEKITPKVLKSEISKKPRGLIRILCIDDEPQILDIIGLALQSPSYTVTAKSNSEEAFLLFQKNPQAFDLVITDQSMPKLLGINLIAKMKSIRPELPYIIMTGFGDEGFMQLTQSVGINAILNKPFMPKELQNCVEQVLFQE